MNGWIFALILIAIGHQEHGFWIGVLGALLFMAISIGFNTFMMARGFKNGTDIDKTLKYVGYFRWVLFILIYLIIAMTGVTNGHRFSYHSPSTFLIKEHMQRRLIDYFFTNGLHA